LAEEGLKTVLLLETVSLSDTVYHETSSFNDWQFTAYQYYSVSQKMSPPPRLFDFFHCSQTVKNF